MKIGCMNKNNNQVEYVYTSNRIKALPAPYGKEPYVQFEITEGTLLESYIWNGTQVVVDSGYIPPEPDYASLGAMAVKRAVEFGQELMIRFAGENVALGITQAGKTKEVADYLADVTRYLQTGSLYEVINEIDSLILAGIPSELSPYITQVRMEEFKSKVNNYLTQGQV